MSMEMEITTIDRFHRSVLGKSSSYWCRYRLIEDDTVDSFVVCGLLLDAIIGVSLINDPFHILSMVISVLIFLYVFRKTYGLLRKV